MARDKKNEQPIIEEDDPYAHIAQDSSNTLETNQKESARARKWNKLKQKFETSKQGVKQGFMMGAMVGGGFGVVMGMYAALQYRSLLILPITALGSAASFGFFMACGTFIRSAPMEEGLELNMIRYNMLKQQYEQEVPMWQLKYMNKPLSM